MSHAIGIDIGGTHFRLAAVDHEGRYSSILKFPSEGHLGPNNLISRVISAISAMRQEGDLLGIGIGMAGAIDHIKGEVRFSPNLPGWNYIPLSRIIEAQIERPVLVDNDVNLIALGEKWLGAGRPYENFLCVALGTGVGGGLILQNQIWHGCGTAGEIGHMTIDRHGARCNCGNYGCLETTASATGLIRLVREGLKEGKDTIFTRRVLSNPEKLSPRMIAEAAQEGDLWARELFEEVGKTLGIALASTMNLLCLDAIVIGGGICEAWDLFIGSLRTEYVKRVMPGTKPEVPILPWQLKDAAGILGAAASVFRNRAS